MKKQFRKPFLFALPVLVFVLVLAGCSTLIPTEADDEAEHVFTVYSDGDYISQTLIDEFANTYGIEINYVTGDRTPSAFETTLFTDDTSETDPAAVEQALTGTETTDADSSEASEEEAPLLYHGSLEGLSLSETLEFTHAVSLVKSYVKADQEWHKNNKKSSSEDSSASKFVFDEGSIEYEPAVYDVILTSGDQLGELIETNLLLPLDDNSIQNAENIDEEFTTLAYDPEHRYTVTTMWQYMGLLANAALLNEQITSWDVLWEEANAGQILMPAGMQDSLAVSLLSMGEDVLSTDEALLNSAFDHLAEQTSLVADYSYRNSFILMENGLAALTPCYSGDAVAMMSENPSLVFLIPQGGTFRTTFGYCIPAESQFQEEALAFVNFMCSATNLAKNAVHSRYASTSTLAIEQMSDSWKNNPVLYPDASVTGSTSILTSLPEELRTLYKERWDALTLPAEADPADSGSPIGSETDPADTSANDETADSSFAAASDPAGSG